MLLSGPDAASTRHLAAVADDILVLLGPGVELDVLAVEVEDDRSVRLCAAYRLAGTSGKSIGRGANVIEAHAQLRASIVEDRIGLGLRLLV